ncbi:MAG: hypothetical protein R2847_11475 [Bacteroidia bacterium]
MQRTRARREIVEQYIKRLKDLEDCTSLYSGVEKSFATGRSRIARNCRKEKSKRPAGRYFVLIWHSAFKTEMTYSGQVKVTVIREKRAVMLSNQQLFMRICTTL